MSLRALNQSTRDNAEQVYDILYWLLKCTPHERPSIGVTKMGSVV